MKKPWILVAAVLLAAAGGYWIYLRAKAPEEQSYRLGSVERGDLEAAVSATGALSAVTTVSVGTQVSGRIDSTLVDFNDRVKKGQLIARIDPTLQQQAVRDAQAGLERARAEAEQKQQEFDRNQSLFNNKVLTEIEFNTAKYALAIARANVKSAEVALERARRNLEYTSIEAPIDGIVVERNVDVGQTVTASMSTPQLFLIAQDLSQMQILASVDESDIGVIQPDQPVRFTVQAYPNESFEGRVQQVRLQSKSQENVVNYTVVVAVRNSSGRLLPGMTATLEFLTGVATDVFTVPNAALRFRPPQDVMEQARERLRAARGQGAGAGSARGDTPAGAGRPARGRSDAAVEGLAGARVPGAGAAQTPGGLASDATEGAAGRARVPGMGRRNVSMLWYLDARGQLTMTPVRTGITDGQRTQVEGPGLEPGMQVVLGMVEPPQGNAANPFQFRTAPAGAGAGGGGFRGRPGGF